VPWRGGPPDFEIGYIQKVINTVRALSAKPHAVAPTLTWTASLVLVAAVAVLDWLTPAPLIVSVLYVVPLVLTIQHDSRRVLWGLALLCVLLNFGVHFAQTEALLADPTSIPFLNRVLAASVLVVLGAILHVLLGVQRAVNFQRQSLIDQNARLEAGNRELAAREQELDLRRREAEEASLRKTRFLAAISHDIRTPVNAINLLAELMRRTAANRSAATEIPPLAEKLRTNAVALIELINDLLDVARFDQGNLDIQEREFALNGIMAEECQRLAPLAQQKYLQLVVEPGAAAVTLRTDRVKLARILANLIGNAIKFTETGSVRVASTILPDGRPEIRVIDSGVGIAPEHLPHIFDEFIQLRNPERDRTKGTGLGLAICKRLAEALGGTIAAQSHPNHGTTLILTLPASCVLPLV